MVTQMANSISKHVEMNFGAKAFYTGQSTSGIIPSWTCQLGTLKKGSSHNIFEVNIQTQAFNKLKAADKVCPQKKQTGLNIIVGIVQKYMSGQAPLGDNFGKRTA